jgi:DNA polymerase-3 subunit epsilon
MNTSALLEQPLGRLPFTLFDVETTGLFPADGHRICEVALLRVRAGRVEARFETLIDPQRPLDPQAFAVNGISPTILHDAPCFPAVADALMELIDGTVLVAHNAPFDLLFLTHELALLGRPAPLNPVLDTLTLARRLLRQPSYSLAALARELDFPQPTHRAMRDVLALQGLFAYLVNHMSDLGITTLDGVLRRQRGLLPDQPEPVPPPPIAQALRQGRRLRIIYSSRTTVIPVERLIQPIELTQGRRGIFLRAYCYLRNDLRSFALTRIEAAELE